MVPFVDISDGSTILSTYNYITVLRLLLLVSPVLTFPQSG
jgi:hypothetical protein